MIKKLSSYPGFINLLILLLIFSGCKTPKDTTYFQTIPYNSEVKTLISKDFEHRVKPGDVLSISILSPSEEVKNYNRGAEGHTVDKFGNIQIYNLGEVKVLDLTTAQVKDRITRLLIPDYFKLATVTVQFVNHRVIVMGAVGKPGVIPMPTEHLSIIEAIALSGDLSEKASKDNILVIRNTDNGKMFYRVNMLDGSVFNSNYYYLQSEDVIYVEDDKELKKGVNGQQLVSYVISGISLFFLLFDRIFK